MKSHAPNKEEKAWMESIVEFGCVVCARTLRVHTPPEVHHIYGKARKGTHLLSLPLCHKHHRGGEDTKVYTSRHPWKRRFEERYGTETELLEWLQGELGARKEAS